MKKFSYWGFFCIAVIITGCKGDSEESMNYELAGKWKIYEAFRDGDLTTTLEDGYFEFIDSVMTTNILGSPVSGQFAIKDGLISHESSLAVTYDISHYSGDTMHLSTEIRGYDFLFKIEKEGNTKILSTSE